MLSTHPQIAFVLDATKLNLLVDLAHTGGNTAGRRYVRPWLTICAEPISQTVLAFDLHPDLPDLSIMRSLLYLAFAPTVEHPHGRMPDELWGDASVLFSALRQQHCFEQLSPPFHQVPFWKKGAIERLFSRLMMDLRRDFPAAQRTEQFAEDSSPTFSEVDQWCKQWVSSLCQNIRDEEQGDFLAYCETQWSTREISTHTLDLLLEGPLPASVTSAGIEYRDAFYWHPKLPAPHQQDVTIRTIVSYLPPSQLEVFVQGCWVCSAPLVSYQQARESRN